jgi:GNAT superfamily N-acetyltransferase
MEIRPATGNDIPAIVELLKLTLGESLMPKSEAFWRWKHIDNPFGTSPVLLAFEKEQLIGVRAFMRWAWRCGDRVYRAVRAVDTATHPAHQGRGIFKTLTLQLLDQCRQEGVDFVFNTPNENSKPGYLKMGWNEAGRLPVAIRPYCRMGKSNRITHAGWPQAEEVFHRISQFSLNTLTTAVTPSYLLWRYERNPNVHYSIVSRLEKEPFLLVYRKRRIKSFNELRVVDYFGDRRIFADALHWVVRAEPGIGFFSVSGLSGLLPRRFPVGPMVTVRMLSDFAPVRTFERWSPSLGDLELF